MDSIKSMFAKLSLDDKIKNNLTKAKDKYGEKAFVQEHVRTYDNILKFGWVASAISILSSALVFLYLFPNLPVWASLLIGVVVASLFELVKLFVTELGFEAYFKSNSVGLILMASIGLYLISVFTSSFGGYNAYTLLKSSNKSNIDNLVYIKKDSINARYDSLALSASNKAQAYFDKVSWMGKLNNKNQPLYNALLSSVDSIRAKQEKVISDLSKEKDLHLKKSTDKLSPYLYVLIGFSLLNELVIFFFSRFKEFYLFKSNQQEVQIKKQAPITLDRDRLKSLVEMLALGNINETQPIQQIQSIPVSPTKQKNRIGFEMKGAATSTRSTTVSSKGAATKTSTRSTTVSKKGGLSERPCLNCGDMYTPKVSWQKYCKKSCNHSANDFKLKN